jgi:hypothetical protein
MLYSVGSAFSVLEYDHGKKYDQIRRHPLSTDTQRYWLAGLAGSFDLSNCAVLLVTGVMKLGLSLL